MSPLPTKRSVLSLLETHPSQIIAVGVKRLGLFGTLVREQQNAESDVDLRVELEPERKTFDNFIHLSFYLQALFQREVEVVTPESLSLYIGSHTTREAEYVPFAA